MIEPEVGKAERQRALPRQTESISTWRLLRRAQFHQYKLTEPDAGLAHTYLNQALEQDPNSVDGLCVAGWQYFWDLSARRGGGHEWKSLEGIAQRVISLEPLESQGWELLGIAIMMGGRPRDSRPIFEQAVRLNPSNAWAWSNLGSTFYLCGEPEKGVAPIEKALRLSPFDLYAFHAYGELGHCHFLMSDWDAALSAISRSLRLRSNYWLARVLQTAVLARAGRLVDARSALESLLTRRPQFSMRDIRWIAYDEGEQFNYLVDSLAMAGWEGGTHTDQGSVL